MTTLVDVAVPLPVRRPYTYRVPDELVGRIGRGQRVLVPFRTRRMTGWVLGTREGDDEDLKEVLGVVDDEPLIGDALLGLADEMARRYFCGPGEVLSALLPAGVRRGSLGKRTAIVRATPRAGVALQEWPADSRHVKQRELLELLVGEEAGVPKQTLLRVARCSDSPLNTLKKKGLAEIHFEFRVEDPFARLDIEATSAPELVPDQVAATERLRGAIEAGRHGGFLLHGVTGSGKTEVYLDAIEACLERGRGAIVMVPEISLTPQTLERFESRFGCVAVLHSHLTDAERARQWQELHQGHRKIAIGPRSAVFAPVRDLGLVVLDEEHETTFKQQNTPRYQARDVALMRGRRENAVVVLGSATPSLESWELAQTGRIEKLSMPRRIGGIPMPEVSIIDMRAERAIGPAGLFSPVLVNMMTRALERGEQTLLFLNRRGYNTSLLCRKCGHTVECRNCSIPLVFYRSTGELLCHYCNHRRRPPTSCPECRSAAVRFGGFGTETVEHAARTLFRDARVARMDGETMRQRHAHEDMFKRLKDGEIDILVGTQMVAKGLDIPRITLIGVVSADTSLLIPDFRAAERTFQLMTQVSGRAGRGSRPGRVFVQTYTPDHYSLKAASRHDFVAFAEEELAHRRSMGYPPYGHLVRIVAQGKDAERVEKRMGRIAGALEAAPMLGVAVLGPAPCPIEFLKRNWRHHMVLRAPTGEALEELLDGTDREIRGDAHVQVLVDRDPTSMM